MAEQLQIRQVKFDDGAVAQFDGARLHLSDSSDVIEIELDGGGVVDMVWLLTGRRSRAGRTSPKPRPAQRRSPKPKTEPTPADEPTLPAA